MISRVEWECPLSLPRRCVVVVAVVVVIVVLGVVMGMSNKITLVFFLVLLFEWLDGVV